MSTISAGTTTTTAFKVTSDTTGSLLLKTGASGATAIDIDAAQVVSIGNIAVTGGTINNTIIGGTTAAAGSFTTLTAASTVTFNGGTANGVAYLNGSKNLTTGSALTFDGTNFATTGNSRASGQFLAGSTGAATPDFSFIADNTLGIFRAPNVLGFSIAGSEQMRLNATGLGIGTSSPGAKLDVSGGIRSNTWTSNTVGINANPLTGTSTSAQNLRFQTTGADFYIGTEGSTGGGFFPGSTAYAAALYNASATPIQFWTSGALRATLTSAGNFGLGTTNPTNTAGFSRQLQIEGTTAALTLSGTTGTGKYTLGVPGANACGLWDNTASAYRWYVDSSGNFAINNTAPSARLHLTGNQFRHNDSTNSFGYVFTTTSATTTLATLFGGSSFGIQTGGSGTNQLLLDSSGNLGIGVTPSAWGSNYRAVELTAGAISSTTAGNTFMQVSNAAHYDGTQWIYKYTSIAPALYQQTLGQHRFLTAPSGTAGNAISFTQAMTLDASGNLGIGTASPSRKFEVHGTPSTIGGTATGILVSVVNNNTAFNASPTSGISLWNRFNSGGSTFPSAAIQAGKENATDGNYAGYLSFFTVDSVAGVNEGMRLDSSGRLGIGTTSPASRLNVVSGVEGESVIFANTNTNVNANNKFGYVVKESADDKIYLRYRRDGSATSELIGVGSGPFVFGTSNTERARITSGGYSKFSNTGTYSNSALYHEFYQTNNNTALLVRATNATFSDSVTTIQGDRTTTNTSYYLLDCYNGNVSGRFRVADSGNATNTNGSYGTISDAKMKTDIVDAGSQWDDLKAVRFRKFKMKDDPSGITQLGVVAQELEQTSPGLVDEHADRDADGNDLGTTTKSVKSSILLMKAAKALQEAMARIETLEAKVTALESK